MSQDTRRTVARWVVFASVIAAGLALTLLVDVAVRHPLPMLALFLLAGSLSGRHLPFNYTCVALERRWSPLGGTMRELIVPLLILGGWIVAAGQAIDHGPGRALLLLVLIYLVDRVVAWSITEHHHWIAARRSARVRAAAQREPIVVDAEIVG